MPVATPPSPIDDSPHPATTATPAVRQRRKEARPHELLAAALSLFAEKGFAATRTEQVAALAGVSKGTLYLYYPSKEELLKAVIRENLGLLIAEGQDLVSSFGGNTADLLMQLMQTWWERVGNTPASALHKIIVAEVRNFPEIGAFYTDEVITPAHHLMTSAVQRGIDRGEFRPVPVNEVAICLLAPVIFLSLHQHSIGVTCPFDVGGDPRRVVATHIDIVLRGLLCHGDNRDAVPPLDMTTPPPCCT